MTAQIFALCNQKGGVGKSTTTFHLARAAVLRGQRVL
ncbi:MAG: ParA family protein, partial [Microbacteriaceae bacterium]|nr:ParA family protein [Microbacteriaceae bacterium]